MLIDDTRRGLIQFVPPIFLPVPVLLLEATEFLADVRKILPAAQIAFMADELTPDVKKICAECRADIISELPPSGKIFEIIIAPQVLTVGENFYATLFTLNRLLRDSGFLLTQFANVRFVGVLEKLRRGRFFDNERKFWAKSDVVRLLDDAAFKEIRFLPGIRENFSVNAWENFGFDNFSDDLATRTWLVKACKCTAEVAALKEIFTPEIRAELSKLLHRIDSDIDAEENFLTLMKLCDHEKIFDEYLTDFIAQVVVHDATKNFIRNRAENFGRTLNLDP